MPRGQQVLLKVINGDFERDDLIDLLVDILHLVDVPELKLSEHLGKLGKLGLCPLLGSLSQLSLRAQTLDLGHVLQVQLIAA